MATIPDATAAPAPAESPSPARTPGHCPEISAITDWLIRQGLLRADFETLLEGFCTRLVAIGVPLRRGYVSVQTLHPRVRGMGCSWRSDRGIQTELYIHRLTPSADFLESPFKYMLDERLLMLRLRLADGEGDGFPLLRRFRSEGMSDYLAQVVGFGLDGVADGRTGVVSSWSTTRPGGFGAWDLAVLEHLQPRLAIALQARLSHDIAVNLLDAYLGAEAGRRILSGEVHRGSLQAISAVILYADLRGFTAVADRWQREVLVEALNAYFDCFMPAITDHGGEVLKLLGDGLLATFPLEGRDPAEVCERALDAAAEALRCVREHNAGRDGRDGAVMDLDIALHLGDVFFGNVGSADRLDFTLIGPAVNEASRIEALCAQHERSLLISETFARAATRSGDRLVSIGRFALRGVRAAQSLYTLDGT